MSEPVFLGIIFGSVAFFLNLGVIIIAMFRLGKAVEKFDSVGQVQALEISQLKVTVDKLVELISKVASQGERLDGMSQRIGRQEKLVDDLRRGEGMILPLERHFYPPRGDGGG